MLRWRSHGKIREIWRNTCSPFVGPSSNEFQCLTSLNAATMSPNERLDLEVFTGSEYECELFYDRDPGSCASSLYNIHIIDADGDDDAGTSVEQPEIRTHDNTELAMESPLYPKPADSSVATCDSPSCEQLTKSHKTRSHSLESIVAATTDCKGQPRRRLSANSTAAVVVLTLAPIDIPCCCLAMRAEV